MPSEEEIITSKKDDGLFFVVCYNPNGSINKEMLCDSVRKNSDKKELVCREWGTNETYIFSYPVSVTDVTYAKDYIKALSYHGGDFLKNYVYCH